LVEAAVFGIAGLEPIKLSAVGREPREAPWLLAPRHE
jgi:hypothetical protein